MKTPLFRLVAAVAVGALTASAVSAAYNPAIVSADARWVLYADFNDLRTSELGKELIDALEKGQRSDQSPVGINFPKLLATVGSVTAYGTNLTSDPAALDGALIAQGTADLRKIIESVLLQGTLADPKAFSEVEDLPFPAYAISDPKAEENNQPKLVVAFPPEPIVLVSKSKAQLVKAREVFRGTAPSLAKNSGSPLTRFAAHAKGAYLFAASVVPTEPLFPQKGAPARLLELAKSGSISLGERGSDLFAHAELSASSDRNAEKLMKILEGLTAMLSLAETNDRQLADFLNSTEVKRNNDVVTLELAYPSARLVQLTQNLRAQAEARPVQKVATITVGRVVAEWTAAEESAQSDKSAQADKPGEGEGSLSWRTVENVALANGDVVTLGRALNGGRNARFERVEIVPANGGAPLVFRRDFMRTVRASLLQFPFPGTDGTYTLKVAYANDPERKAKFAVSVHDPKAQQGKGGRSASGTSSEKSPR